MAASLIKVNKIFLFFTAGIIIFLTGCAPKGYHKNVLIGEGYYGGPKTGLSEGFLWPVRGGSIAVPFGAEDERMLLKGVIINTNGVSEVQAVQDGQVVLVDQNLKGYGKTLILQHSNDFSTVYAKNSEILVVPGQRVRKGDLIARVNSKLYFELRKNLKAEDPALYFKNF